MISKSGQGATYRKAIMSYITIVNEIKNKKILQNSTRQ